MNSLDFLNEVKNSSICPENFEQIYSEFQSIQAATIEALKEVHRICEKNNIHYQLAYGSLLGVIRDGGQIPWDYDIDIIIAYEQRKILIDALNRELNNAFYFSCTENDEKCRNLIVRVAPVGFRSEVVHVDIFLFVGSPEDSEDRHRFAKKLKYLADAKYAKISNIKEDACGSMLRYIKLVLCKKLPFLCAKVSNITKEYERLCSLYSSSDSTYCLSADSFATWKEIPSRILWDTKLVECAYGTIRIPVHYDELLKLMYGDFMTIPSLERRINEVINSYKRIKWFSNSK